MQVPSPRVILSEVNVSRSEAFTQSKDPIPFNLGAIIAKDCRAVELAMRLQFGDDYSHPPSNSSCSSSPRPSICP